MFCSTDNFLFKLQVAILENSFFLRLMYILIFIIGLIGCERRKQLYYGARVELLALYPFPHLFIQKLSAFLKPAPSKTLETQMEDKTELFLLGA